MKQKNIIMLDEFQDYIKVRFLNKNLDKNNKN